MRIVDCIPRQSSERVCSTVDGQVSDQLSTSLYQRASVQWRWLQWSERWRLAMLSVAGWLPARLDQTRGRSQPLPTQPCLHRSAFLCTLTMALWLSDNYIIWHHQRSYATLSRVSTPGLPWVWGFPWGFPWVWVWYGYGDCDESPWVLWVIWGDFWMDVTFAEYKRIWRIRNLIFRNFYFFLHYHC